MAAGEEAAAGRAAPCTPAAPPLSPAPCSNALTAPPAPPLLPPPTTAFLSAAATDLAESVDRARASAARADEDAHRERVSALSAEAAAAQDTLAELRAEKAALGASSAELQQAAAAVAAKAAAIEAQRLDEIPRVRHSISLYANISCIKWDYSSDMLAGHVAIAAAAAAAASAAGGCADEAAAAAAKLAAVRAFSIDPSRHSDFDIATQLWDAVDGHTAGFGAAPPLAPLTA